MLKNLESPYTKQGKLLVELKKRGQDGKSAQESQPEKIHPRELGVFLV